MKRILLIAVVSLFALASFPSIAHAHPAYKDSSPQAGSTADQPPTEVWVEFTERIEGGSLTVYDSCGERADHGDDELNLTSDRLTTGTHGDKAGTYRVVWSVLGSDGHNTKGEFSFMVADGGACPRSDEDTDEETKTQRESNNQTRSDDEDDDAVEDETSSDESTEGGRRQRTDDRTSDRSQREKNPRDRPTRLNTDLVQSPVDGTGTPDNKSVWDGLPMGDFLIALAVAALIGAAGGRIYAGIIGPRR